jgi:hypothetical protein
VDRRRLALTRRLRARALPDRAWFTGARRAGFVRSAAYGEFDPAPELLYRREQGVTLINSTPVYGTPIQLRAALRSRARGSPSPSELTVNALNLAACGRGRRSPMAPRSPSAPASTP